MDDVTAYQVIFDELGMAGRMLSGSKAMYEQMHQGHEVVFNANLVVEGLGKCWFGDVDLTTDGDKLQTVADRTGLKLYVLREMDARFDTEKNPRLEKAVKIYEPRPAPEG